MSDHTLSLHDPADLITAVPYLLGFPPRDSLVVMVLDGARVIVTARYDAQRVGLAPEPHVFAPLLAATGVAHPQAVLLAYLDERVQAGLLLESARSALGVPVRLAVVVSADRWWLSDDPVSSPGSRVEPVPAVAAQAVYEGMSVANSRDDIALALSGPPQQEVARLRRQSQAARRAVATWTVPARTRAMADRIARASQGPLPSQVLLECLALLDTPAARDVVWAHLCPQTADIHVGLWSQVVGVAPPGEHLLAVCALGFSAWQAGQGALFGLCTDEGARIDPSHHLVDMLETIGAGCVPPSLWELCREAAGAA